MKVALVHDYLNQYGGAERVLEVLMEMFPDAPIYTLLYDEEKTLNRFSDRVVKTSFLDSRFVSCHHRLFIPFMPIASQSFNLGDKYDLIISDSAGYAKGFVYGKNTFHISYCHTPLRYAWETDEYFAGKLFKTIFKPIFNYLKRWDFRAGQKPDILLANSNFIADKIRRYYGREAKVIYPPVDFKKFYFDPAIKKQDYFLALGRLMRYKKFDLVIDAFSDLRLPLKIVGNGPKRKNLELRIKNLGLKNIELVSFVKNEDELRKIYAGARALIFPQIEDFGLVAVEAQACGAPVIAFAGGGALESIKEGTSGIFFREQTPQSLTEAIKRFKRMDFDSREISQLVQRFSAENFKNQFMSAVNQLMGQNL